MKHEEHLQIQVCNYLRLQYPKVLFACDLASGIKLSIGQAVKAGRMRQSRGYPDLMIFEARGEYHGLMMELKREGTRIYIRSGGMTMDAHIREQARVLEALTNNGYKAVFAIGFDEAIKIIDEYLTKKPCQNN